MMIERDYTRKLEEEVRLLEQDNIKYQIEGPGTGNTAIFKHRHGHI